jgi:serine/threonine protein kinase
LKKKNDNILTPIGYYIASQLFIEIVKGVQYLHQNNIIHRDLNPNNILIKREVIDEFEKLLLREEKNRNFVKIGDFGLIKIHSFAQQSHTIDKGTPKYMAPEVINDKHYEFKADIYSLALIFEEMFCIELDRYSYRLL